MRQSWKMLIVIYARTWVFVRSKSAWPAVEWAKWPLKRVAKVCLRVFFNLNPQAFAQRKHLTVMTLELDQVHHGPLGISGLYLYLMIILVIIFLGPLYKWVLWGCAFLITIWHQTIKSVLLPENSCIVRLISSFAIGNQVIGKLERKRERDGRKKEAGGSEGRRQENCSPAPQFCCSLNACGWPFIHILKLWPSRRWY